MKTHGSTKVAFCSLLLLASFTSLGQFQKTLLGAWRKSSESVYGDLTTRKTEADNYLRYEFSDRKNLVISSHYTQNASNSPTIQYEIDKNILLFGFGRKFLIEQNNEDSLVIVDLEGGLTENSIRLHFVREHLFLDNLPLNPHDKIKIGGNTAYLTSQKLRPVFETIHPDFHQFVSMRMNSEYEKGENYTYATFSISPNGTIDNINILHHINQAADIKFVAAIKKSKGLWTLPKLNGEAVTIAHSIEDRDFGKRSYNPNQPINTTPLTFERYNNTYLKNFNAFVKSYLRKDYSEALSHLTKCEEVSPREANLFYLKYLCFKELGDQEKAGLNLDLLQASKLKYLIKERK